MALRIRIPWHRFSFRIPADSGVWPQFGSSTVPKGSHLLLPTNIQPYTDLQADPSTWFKNCLDRGYTPVQAEATCAYPSLLYPPEIEPGYSGFIEVSPVEDDQRRRQLAPYGTPEYGDKGLGHHGETVAVDPIVWFSDFRGEKYFLMVMKKIPEKTFFIGGGGMLDPAESPAECGLRELQEECFGLGHLPKKKSQQLAQSPAFKELQQCLEQASVVYAGPLVDRRTASDRFMSTIALSVEITPNLAKELTPYLTTHPGEDCQEPQWVSLSQLGDCPINESHYSLLHLAHKPKVRYVQFPAPYWNTEQMRAFRSIMNNLKPHSEIDFEWTKKTIPKDVPLMIQGADDLDRVAIWDQLEGMMKKKSTYIFIDPSNPQLKSENPRWYQKLYEHYLWDPKIAKIYIFRPEDLGEFHARIPEYEQLLDLEQKPIIYIPLGLDLRCSERVQACLYTYQKPKDLLRRLSRVWKELQK